MKSHTENILKEIYAQWKQDAARKSTAHPSEDELISFLENTASPHESDLIQHHITQCHVCAELLAACIRLEGIEEEEAPQELLAHVRALIRQEISLDSFDIILALKEESLELLSTCGDVLVGQEVVAASLLRSRGIQDFKDSIHMYKDFQEMRIEVKIEHDTKNACTLAVAAKEKNTQRIIHDARVSLKKDEVELESYRIEPNLGRVSFEHVGSGNYALEIAFANDRCARITLEIRV